MKKIICLMLALMLLCSVSALAEMAGGWTVPEDTTLTGEAADAFYSAMDADSETEPMVLMGTQVVAGVNYALLCDEPGNWTICYVYSAVSGENQLMREQPLMEIEADDMTGGWTKLYEDDLDITLFDALEEALDGVDVLFVDECYILGYQVVSGMNTLLLCRTMSTDEQPVLGWALMTMYVDLEGHASITEIQPLTLSLTE